MSTEKIRKQFKTSSGSPQAFGCITKGTWTNFALYSSVAKNVTLGLFNNQYSNEPQQKFKLCPNNNRTGNVWHITINDIPEKWTYAYLIEDTYSKSDKWILDPYTKSVHSPKEWGAWREHATDAFDLEGIRSYVSRQNNFDWQGITRPFIPPERAMIYEMHVRGFTQDPSSSTSYSGSYLGIIEKIPYLKELGINTVELLPVFEFNECEYDNRHPKTKEQLHNYWGYSTIGFFAPMRRFTHGQEADHPILEFKEMVRELHRAGIAVILDVVFNHSSEKEVDGPTQSFKGIDAPTYYMIESDSRFSNYSGCGNTLNCNHPVMRELIRDCLRYWYCEMQVDGFRFDLASILCRDSNGAVLEKPPLIEILSQDPVLADCLLIAEPWDAGGLYQVGSFPSWGRWAEWNGIYRDEIRRFIKGSGGSSSGFARAFCGSDHLYANDRSPYHSINFITAHDGFTLRDLVSYNDKHNSDNGEENRDGCNQNDSWNCGEEGESSCPMVQALRARQMRNFHLALVLSQGTPMFSMGDEYGHSRLGNNNPWCQDGAVNWFQWDSEKQDLEFLRFVRLANQFRNTHSHFHRIEFLNEQDIQWHGNHGTVPDWDLNDGFIACTLFSPKGDAPLFIAFNTSHEEVVIQIPDATEHSTWLRVADTGLTGQEDFLEPKDYHPICSTKHKMLPYSALLLQAI